MTKRSRRGQKAGTREVRRVPGVSGKEDHCARAQPRSGVAAELTKVREELRPYAEAYPNLETAWAISEGKPHDVKVQSTAIRRTRGTGATPVPADTRRDEGAEEETGEWTTQLAEWID